MAHRVRGFLRSSPVLLLTATPMQNSLAELWGLVQYVEPTGTLLGDITTFRKVFCAEDDRTLVPGQEHELQRRLAVVLQRTLRRQAQEFLDRPFTQRRCRLYEYTMSDDERSLYDDVTEYLLQPSLYAFAGRQRRLLLIGFHRRMASSIPALAASLENVAARLRRLQAGLRSDETATDDVSRPRGGGRGRRTFEEVPPAVDREAVASELARVEDFVARANSLPHDAKARSFQDAIRVILDLGRDGRGSGKAVVFTESITTQEYLRRLLLDIGLQDEDVTLVSRRQRSRSREAGARAMARGRRIALSAGSPADSRGRRAARARARVSHTVEGARLHGGRRERVEPPVLRDGHQLRSAVEPAADRAAHRPLPPVQPAARRHGGQLHRAGQRSAPPDVRDPEPEARSVRKVLDASDTVLHEPRTDAPEIVVSALSLEFEKDLRNIYSRSRTLDEVTREIAALRDKIAGRRDAYEKEYDRTSQIIESRFDEDVRKVFRRLREELPHGLAISIGTSPTSWTATLPRTALNIDAPRRLAGSCSKSRPAPACPRRSETGGASQPATPRA